MSKILFTGFGLWGNHMMNPSWECLKSFHPKTHNQEEFTVKPLPVLWGSARLHLLPTLRSESECVIAFGLAESRTKVSIETIAFNACDTDVLDASGQKPPAVKVAENGPDSLNSTFPAEKILKALQKKEFPAELSEDAGRFICNETLYALLNHGRQSKKPFTAGFIHVPPTSVLTTEQWKELPQIILDSL
jgi:pyroglutamyl-peptidase